MSHSAAKQQSASLRSVSSSRQMGNRSPASIAALTKLTLNAKRGVKKAGEKKGSEKKTAIPKAAAAFSRISVFGLGYVGSVTMACLARAGFTVVGVDLNSDKVAMVETGKSPIIESGLEVMLADAVSQGLMRATQDVAAAVADTDVSLISVGTPSRADGAVDVSHVLKVCEEIGLAICDKGTAHTVIIRSTVPPGTTDACAKILREKAGKVPVAVAFNPEFLREGSAIRDYEQPAYTVIGTHDAVAEQALRALYASVVAPIMVCTPGEAEMLKYAANTWHATKITFANEIGRLAKHFAIDGRTVMAMLCQDTKLNVSPAYLRPGFAYGGSCLPKDVRACHYLGNSHGFELPLLSSLTRSNHIQITRAAELILRSGKRRIGLLGLAFKPGTDDLRESPAVELAEFLMGKGCELHIYDPAVSQARLTGANKTFIEKHIPHLSRLLIKDGLTLLKKIDILVVIHATAETRSVVVAAGERALHIVDLADVPAPQQPKGSYEGICW
jgi:GDP-mannose 6-dehydrogenase